MNSHHSFDFFTYDELADHIGQHNTVLDSHSVLISRKVTIGKGNIFYPNVVIECKEQGTITIGDGNTFYPGVYIVGTSGSVHIGNRNELGPAGVTIKANSIDAAVAIGNDGRYCDGVSIMGYTRLGNGSQILGNITVQNCLLHAGGTYREPNPDDRAAVLKGFGLARNIALGVGQVINGTGNFDDAPIEQQRAYHPPKSN